MWKVQQSAVQEGPISTSGPENTGSVAHRRRIKTEEKAKVVAADWGKGFIQFPTALAVLP